MIIYDKVTRHTVSPIIFSQKPTNNQTKNAQKFQFATDFPKINLPK